MRRAERGGAARHLGAALLAVGCCAAAARAAAVRGDAEPAERVVIGSKNFTESRILGEMMALMLEAHTNLEVEHKSGLGGTLVVFSALREGGIHIYPDYTGTGWSIVLKEEERVSDPLRAYLHVQERYRELFDIEWLPPFGPDNSYALAMTEERAAELDVSTISDLVRHQEEISAGFSIEFTEREDGYPGVSEYYGLDLGEVRAMEHGLAYEAIASGEIDLVDAYATDAKLLRYELRILADDREFFPPYDVAPLVRGDLLRRRPEVREVLSRLAFRIPHRTMMELNYDVEVGGRGFREVARGFLEREGLLEEAAGAARPERARGTGFLGFLGFLAGRWEETLKLAWEHVQLTAIAVALASAIAIPLGIAITRSRFAERISLGAAGVVQTIPSLALLAFMIAVPGLGLSVKSAIVALLLYSVLPVLRNTFTGLKEVDPDLVDAARGMGLTQRQIMTRIQLPLATRTIMAGIRTATVIAIGIATLAAFIGAGGLGEPIVTGLYLNDTQLIMAGAIPAALLALLADAVLARVERILTPRGLRVAAAEA